MGTSKRFIIYFLLISISAIPISFSACTRGFLAADITPSALNLSSESQLQTYLQGKTLYESNCMGCHGALETSAKRNRSANAISSAIQIVGQMSALQSLKSEEIAQIAFALNNSRPAPPTNPLPVPVANTNLQCIPNSDPGITPVRRLTKEEYINTLMDLLRDSSLIGRQDRAYESFQPVGLVAPLLGSLPEDDRKKQFSRLDHIVSGSLLEGQFMVTQALAKAIAQSDKLRNYAGDCALDANPTADCVRNFISSFGKRAFRRPVKADEITDLKATYDQFATSGARNGFEALFETLLLSPQFLFIVESEGTPVAGRSDLLKLTDYELASRLSYTLIQSMPTDELFSLADSGKLTTDPTAYQDQINKLTADNPSNGAFGVSGRTHPLMMSAFQRTIMAFYDEWLQVGSIPELAGTKVMQNFMNVYNDNQFVWNDSMWNAKAEARDFVFRLTFLENKKYSDLLTDDSAVLINTSAANYYHMPPGTPFDQVIHLPNRAGILTRAPFLTTGTELTSPIRRGVFLRRKILCDNLPSPNPDALPDRSLDAPEVNPNMTTRERFTAKTASTTCMSCHSSINPLGFAMEDFDSLGRNRSQTFEPIFKVDGDNVTLLNKLKVNASVSSLDFTPGDQLSANGGIQLSQTLAASEKANTCFVRQVYRFTLGRLEGSGDDCLMKSMYDSMNQNGGSILSLLKALPNHPNFKLKKIGN